MWAQHEQLSLIPALADSPPSEALASVLALSLRLLEAEKGGREVASWDLRLKSDFQLLTLIKVGPLNFPN